MKILFIFPREKPYNSQSVREFPSGGTERAAIFLGEAFRKLGHEVEWLTTPDEVRQGPKEKPDVVITQVAELLEDYPDSKKVWWVHHFSDQPVIKINAAYGRCFADKVVTLSRCQHDDFKNNLRIDSTVIGHGVWLDEVITGLQKDPYRLIYASTPFRGLDRIPALFSQIREREPRATLAICSSMGTYGTPEQDSEYTPLFDELGRIPGVELKGALNQAELYGELARASIFFYPSTWPETYCMVMDEAIAHRCIPFHSGLGALQERWEGFPMSSLAEAVSTVIGSDSLKTLPNEHRYQVRDWLGVAKQWETEVLN